LPRYEYKCKECGKFEVNHSIKEKLDNCPDCGKTVERLISDGILVIYNAKGFHSTDYK